MKSLFSRITAIFLTLSLVLGLVPFSFSANTGDEIVILYTNDVHTNIAGFSSLRYSNIAAMKKELQNSVGENNVFLVDAGDHVTGSSYGTYDNGQTVVKLMSAAGYDVATFGNHEFDYGMNGALKLAETASFQYLSCNLYRIENGEITENVLDSYKIFETDGKKIAFVGITTPETFENIRVDYFKDKNGNYIYGISCSDMGQALYADVQKAVDSARAEGADYVIAVGHLGIDESSLYLTSEAVIENTEGLDAFIDGHSHSIVENRQVLNKNGEPVTLTQTGNRLANVGKMTISADGIKTELINSYSEYDSGVKVLEDAWKAEVDAEKTFEVVYDKYNFDPALETAYAETAPDVTDGVVDSLYTKIFEMSGSDCIYESYDGTVKRDAHTPSDGNTESGRYDRDEHATLEESDWYNTDVCVYAAWDTSKLYLCVEIKGAGQADDNVSDANMWAGDGIQIAMYNKTRPGRINYCFGQSGGDLICYPYDYTGLTALQKRRAYGTSKVPEGGFYQTDENTVVYEMALEWTNGFGISPEENLEIPFNISVNMNDGTRNPNSFCGFQIGYGIFNGDSDLINSLRLKLVSEVSDVKSGLIFEENGDIVYYENGEPAAKGLVSDGKDYYFIDGTKKAVKDCVCEITAENSNGLLPAGKYSVGADGKLIIKNGLTVDDDGEIRYYENNVPVAKGLVKDEDGNLYYISCDKKAVKNCVYAFNDTTSNGLFPAGKYEFDSDGKLVIKNGLSFESDGNVRYYENGVAVAKGLVRDANGDMYFINSTKKTVKNCVYAFNDTTSNGLFPAGKYEFDSDGKLIIKNGLSFESDGSVRYYENGVAVAKGLVRDANGDMYFINSTKKAVKNCVYAFSTAKGNGLLAGGKYLFDADGKIVLN